MNKNEFLAILREKLSGLPGKDIEERLSFYSEMIDDRVEEGLTEEQAVLEAGNVDDVTAQIINDASLTKIAKERISIKRKLKTWEIVLLILGSPIWFSLIIAALAVLFSLFVSIFAVLISLWAVFIAVALSSVALVINGVYCAIDSSTLNGIAIIGAGLVCAGISIYLFFGCKALSKLLLKLTSKVVSKIKSCFIKKEVA